MTQVKMEEEGKMNTGVLINEDGPQLMENDQAAGSSNWDKETIIEQIWRDLGGVTTHEEIRKALMEVAPAYENARVKTFVPIFLRRDVLQRLQDGVVQTYGEEELKLESG